MAKTKAELAAEQAAAANTAAPAADTQAATNAAPPAPTSEKLTAIRKRMDEIDDTIATVEKTERRKLMAEMFKLQADEAAEIAEIAKLEKQQKAEAAKAAITADFEAALEAIFAARTDNSEAALAAAATARETLLNKLFGSAPKAAASSNGTTAAPTDGSKSDAILKLYVGYLESGKSDSEARKLLTTTDGYKAGTIWAPINNYRISNGLK